MPSRKQTREEEFANVLTHGAGMLFGFVAIWALLVKALATNDPWVMGSFAVYGICMTLSYVTSTFYHATTHDHRKQLLRQFDHSAIFLHIAGTYTPFTLVVLRQQGHWGWLLFAIVWTAAIAGIWISFRPIKKKSPLKTICYLLMGWVVIIAFKPLIEVFRQTDHLMVLYWLIAGGLFYSAGTIFFLLDKHKYMHPIWHLFVLGGTICHFIAVYLLI